MGLKSFAQRVGMAAKTLTLVKANKQFNAERDPAVLAAARDSALAAIAALEPMMEQPEHARLAATLRPVVDQFKVSAARVDCFLRRDFAGAFAAAYASTENPRPEVAFASLNSALDALGQIKTGMLSSSGAQAYRDAHGVHEAELIAAANRAFSERNPFEPTPKDEPQKAFSSEDAMHSLAMSAAYVHFAGGDLAEASRWVQTSAARFGVEVIARREMNEPTDQFWFYDNLDQPAMERFRAFLRAEVGSAPSAASGPKP